MASIILKTAGCAFSHVSGLPANWEHGSRSQARATCERGDILEIKDLQGLHKAMDAMDLIRPPVILISGRDLSVFELAVHRAREILAKTGKAYESTILSGEPGDGERFQEEVFNIPLFIPARMIVVHRADLVLKPMGESKTSRERFHNEFLRMPDQTLILIEYDGAPSKGFLDIFGERLLHYSTKELYAKQLHETIEDLARKLHLKLDGEAMHELMERVSPGSGSVDRALKRLQALLPDEKNGRVTGNDIREILFPTPGMNLFQFVDALFEGKRSKAIREMERLNPAVDSFFPVLTVLLSRINEIRIARTALAHGYSDQELMDLLGKKHLHPFVQKKTLERLKVEVHAFDDQIISNIYEFLIHLRNEFQRSTPPDKQGLIFQSLLFPVFFGTSSHTTTSYTA